MSFWQRKPGKKKAWLALGLAVLSVFALGIQPAQANPRYASIVMDADTGVILHQNNADKILHPASLTKVMTLLLVFDALDQGRLSLNDRIRISSRAAAQAPSKLGLNAGASIRVEDAIYALVTKSANDIAVAVAEHLGGSESNFARMMTNRATQIGMTRTRFTNASGLHDPRQISTARDMAKMARMVINTYPAYYRYFSTKNFNYHGTSYHNHNRLMNSYRGMDGMKTGYVNASGFNLVASAVRGNRRLIGVVFGGRTANSRNAHMADLLDRGFTDLGDVRVASVKAPPPPRKPGILVAMQNLNRITPAAGPAATDQKFASLNASLQNGKFDELIGQGDYDPAVSKRIETGLTAIAAVKGEEEEQRGLLRPRVQNVTLTMPEAHDKWAVQVGAFTSRAATDKVLHESVQKLPSSLAQKTSPLIAPVKTADGWLFRARLTGYTKSEAFAACKRLKSCLPVAPSAN